jgi:hypothetical protein
MHRTAGTASPNNMDFGTSVASFVHFVLGRARKVIPKSFTKRAAASALVRAKTERVIIRSTFRRGSESAEE